MEKFRHPRFPQYWFRADGVVERAVDSRCYQKAGDILRGRILASGYRQYNLLDADGERRLVRANRVLCEAFYGPPPSPTHHSAHRDGSRLNNTKANLYWATPERNELDKLTHGTIRRGTEVENQHGFSKLHAGAVCEIRQQYTGARGQISELAKRFGVGTTCIKNIVAGRTWKHVRARNLGLGAE